MRKSILFVFKITCAIFLLLFVCVKNVNHDEELYVPPIPPDIQLTDGINSITGSLKMDNWNYRGKDNKFYRYQNGNVINDNAINGSAVNNENSMVSEKPDFSNNFNSNLQVLLYNGNLNLKLSYNSNKYSYYHYPDKLNLQIYYKDNLIFQEDKIVLKNKLENELKNELKDGLENKPKNKPENRLENALKNDMENELENDLNNMLKNEFSDSILSELNYTVFQPKEDGLLLYKITASWYESESAGRGFYGQVIYEFAFYNDVPIEFEISSSQTFPGELVTISAKYVNEDEKITLKSDLVESEIPFYKYEHGQIAVLPLSYNLQPSNYVIELQVKQVEQAEQTEQIWHVEQGKQDGTAEQNEQLGSSDTESKTGANTKADTNSKTSPYDKSSNSHDKNVQDVSLKESYQLKESKEFKEPKEAHRITISVLPKDFPIQYLTVTDEVDKSTRNDEAYEEYNKYVGAARKTETPVKMWDGVFLEPVEGRITTEFGMRRFVNNAPTSYRHSGIDIAADKGTPVKATNSGKVILARHLILTGNTVLIDHGFGIISWSYHMDNIKVKECDDLVKGQIIGTVGSTGFSTGPHLHFAISVHDVFTNPWTLFEHEPAGL